MKLSNLFKPTPRNMKKLGNALVAATTGIAVPAALANLTWFAIIVWVIGIIGKFLTELYVDDQPLNQ